MSRDNRRFDRSGTFHCGACGRLTRNTGDNGGVELCPEDYELAGLENEVSDGHATEEQNAPRMAELKALIIAKGGKDYWS